MFLHQRISLVENHLQEVDGDQGRALLAAQFGIDLFDPQNPHLAGQLALQPGGEWLPVVPDTGVREFHRKG